MAQKLWCLQLVKRYFLPGSPPTYTPDLLREIRQHLV